MSSRFLLFRKYGIFKPPSTCSVRLSKVTYTSKVEQLLGHSVVHMFFNFVPERSAGMAYNNRRKSTY